MNNKALAVILLAVGVILLVMGVQAYHSVGSGLSRVFTGAPTNKAIILLVSGVVLTLAGFAHLKKS